MSEHDIALFPRINHRSSDSIDDTRESINSTQKLQSIFKSGSGSRFQLSVQGSHRDPSNILDFEVDIVDSQAEIMATEPKGAVSKGLKESNASFNSLNDSDEKSVHNHALFKTYPSKISSFLHHIRHGAEAPTTSNLTKAHNFNPNRNDENIFLDTYLNLNADTTTLISEKDLSDLMQKVDSQLSLDSSVLNEMARGTEHGSQKGKFSFLSQYEALFKQKKSKSQSQKGQRSGKGEKSPRNESASQNVENPNADAELVFALSGLDDFNYYLRSTELDHAIADQVKHRQLAGEENVLAIVDHADLVRNYGFKEADNLGSLQKEKLPRARLPIYQMREDRHVTNTSVVGELQKAGDLNSSLDSRQIGVFLHRKLEVRHLQMISFGGTLGVGLYLNSGKAIAIAGGLGTVLAFFLVGLIVLATISSFSEIVTFVSVVDGVSGLCSRYVDESFGFAAGWVYFISFSVGLAAELVASAILLSYFTETKVLTNTISTVGFVSLCFLFCVVSNMITVQVLGEIEYLASFFKIVTTLIFIIVMIVINRGGMGDMGVLGFKYWQYSKSDFVHDVIFGPMRPSFDLRSTGTSPPDRGIGGDLGRFLSLLTAMSIATYAYSGTEIVCIAACEAKEPRKALPKATKRVFWRILLFYCLASFVVSLNIYAGDPRLLRYYYGEPMSGSELENNFAFHLVGGDKCQNSFKLFAGIGNGSQSPWAVAFQSAGLCNWSSVVNGVLFVFALSCGNSQLYASSRTIYALALQRKAPKFLTKCNRYGIPYYAVLIASCPALSAFICVSEKATVVFQNLTSLISSAGVLVWFSMCLAYTRFYFGLKKRPDIISREDKSYPYRSPFQPYLAMFGVFGLLFIILANGFVVFLKGYWNTMFFFASYGALILFALLYCSHRIINGSSMLSLEALDYDLGKRETDIYVWDGGREYNKMKFRDIPHKVIDFLA